MRKYAGRIYEEVLKTSPNNVMALNNLSVLEDNYKKAMEYIMKLEKLCPDNAEFKCNSAVLMLKNGNTMGANMLDELVKKKAITIPAFHFYMDYLMKSQKFTHCEKHLNAFVEENPHDFVGHLLQFNLCSQMNSHDGVAKAAQSILNFENGNEQVKNYISQMLEQVNSRGAKEKWDNREDNATEIDVKEGSLLLEEKASKQQANGPESMPVLGEHTGNANQVDAPKKDDEPNSGSFRKMEPAEPKEKIKEENPYRRDKSGEKGSQKDLKETKEETKKEIKKEEIKHEEVKKR